VNLPGAVVIEAELRQPFLGRSGHFVLGFVSASDVSMDVQLREFASGWMRRGRP
jgi:hypothetical protein